MKWFLLSLLQFCCNTGQRNRPTCSWVRTNEIIKIICRGKVKIFFLLQIWIYGILPGIIHYRLQFEQIKWLMHKLQHQSALFFFGYLLVALILKGTFIACNNFQLRIASFALIISSFFFLFYYLHKLIKFHPKKKLKARISRSERKTNDLILAHFRIELIFFLLKNKKS